ncbi:hypothetical protein C1H46_024271 [Malus baccata]|uniref:TPX2 C-terminal domain-containing protein n=1 Tax=Malus baccata TaxID=106549 RepID=A0A540LUI8_MALBA|nr:hypothetical protein C1H46_024271 [Malus baccata]
MEVTDICVDKESESVTNYSGLSHQTVEKVQLDSGKTKVTSTSLASVKHASKPAAGNAGTKHTVPQPFTLATEKRASCGTRLVSVALNCGNGVYKLSNTSDLRHLNTTKHNQPISPLVRRKPLQPDKKKHSDEEDSCSVASITVASARTLRFRETVASAPTLRCTERAKKRKEFYSRLEEKHQALEVQKTKRDARTKLPPTRAKSPKLGRRMSCSSTSQVSRGDRMKGNHHSMGSYKEGTAYVGSLKSEGQINIQNGNAVC